MSSYVQLTLLHLHCWSRRDHQYLDGKVRPGEFLEYSALKHGTNDQQQNKLSLVTTPFFNATSSKSGDLAVNEKHRSKSIFAKNSLTSRSRSGAVNGQ